MVGDLARREFAESMVAQALERFGRLDVLVNNAGVPKHKHFYDVTPEDIEYTLRVNFLAPAYLTLAAIPAMLRQGEGYIVNISSGAGKLPPPREAVYAASKYALTGPRRLSLFFFPKALMPGAFRWGAGRWDPVPRAVIEEARERARR